MFDDFSDGRNGPTRHVSLPVTSAGVPSEGARPDERIVAAQLPLASDFTLHNQNDSAQRKIASSAVNPASIPAVTINILGPDRVAIDMESAARGAAIVAELQRRDQQPTTCCGCDGSGRKDYGYGERSCDWCGGSGLRIDECRQELVDALSDAMWDAETSTSTLYTSALTAMTLLHERGYVLADEERPALTVALWTRLCDTTDLDVCWADYARAVLALLEERGADVVALARP
jgi:hypothetical protein